MVTFLILVCSLLFIVCFILCSGMVKTNRQLDTICDVLADVKDGNLNRRILAQKAGKIREICYEINEIVEIMQNRIIEQKISEQSYKRLMTGLSHDVKTPLASLIGYLEAIDGRMVKEEKRDRYVNIALMKAIQLKDFTNDLFEWVKLDAKEKVFHFQKLDIVELTRTIILDWLNVFEKKEITYEFQIPETECSMFLDKIAYERIINNLFQNILVHSDADKMKLDMEILDEKVCIDITDWGTGIEEGKLPFIFERLYQCDEARAMEGNGLGLAIVKELLAAHHASIYVESMEGEFTRFKIVFFKNSNKQLQNE